MFLLFIEVQQGCKLKVIFFLLLIWCLQQGNCWLEQWTVICIAFWSAILKCFKYSNCYCMTNRGIQGWGGAFKSRMKYFSCHGGYTFVKKSSVLLIVNRVYSITAKLVIVCLWCLSLQYDYLCSCINVTNLWWSIKFFSWPRVEQHKPRRKLFWCPETGFIPKHRVLTPPSPSFSQPRGR